MLKIDVKRSVSKGIRVYVFKRLEKGNGLNHPYKQLGSFLLSEGYDDELLQQLEPSEIIQLEGLIAECHTALKLGFEPDARHEFIKQSFRIWKSLEDIAEQQVLPHAKRLGIAFNPLKDAMDAYCHSIINVANAINKKEYLPTLEESFATMGINLSAWRLEDNYKKRLNLESRILFKTLLRLKQPYSKTCEEWEGIAKSYGKDKKISAGHLKEWAGEMPGRELKEVKIWVIAVTIDLLLKHGMNPLDLITVDKVVYYWINPRKEHISLEEAKQVFLTTFQPNKGQMKEACAAIEKAFQHCNH
jgi:hypothetical protein